MEEILQKLKTELKKKAENDSPNLKYLTNYALKIANLENLVLKNMRSRQLFEKDVLLLEGVLNMARTHYGRIMLIDLLEIAELSALRRAIALGTSRGLLTTYNDADGWPQHEEVRVKDYDYPEGHTTTGSEDWHYFRRQRIVNKDKKFKNHLILNHNPI